MPSKNKPNALRNLAVVTILVMVGWLIARTWLACSTIVVSGSMAPALLGPHLKATCPACRHVTPIALTENTGKRLKTGKPAACENCGTLIPLPPETPIQPGEKLLVKRNLELTRPLQRWDLVACQDPESPEKIIIKRIVGLPGEAVQIIDGDIFIDGQIARKSLDQQASTAALVYDAEHESITNDSASPQRWIPTIKDTTWSGSNGRFFSSGSKPMDRLTYHHQNRTDGKIVPGPVTDQFAYNQWIPIRRDSFHATSDLMLTFHLRPDKGTLRRFNVFLANEYEITFDYQEDEVIVESSSSHDGTEAAKPKLFAKAPCRLSLRLVPILISTVDRQLTIVVGKKTVIQKPLPKPIPYGASPFSLGSEGPAEVHRLRIYRDVYYVRPTGIKARWGFEKPVQLGEDEYFILGDNSRISEDSRTWAKGPAIRRREIFGRP